MIQLERLQNKGKRKANRKRKRGVEEERQTQSHGLNCRLKESQSDKVGLVLSTFRKKHTGEALHVITLKICFCKSLLFFMWKNKK